MPPAKTTRVRWFLVFWLFVLSAVSYLDRVNISIAGGSIVDAYHLTDVQLGKVFSALVAGYALFQTLGGHLADRFGARRVLTGGVLWWGLFTALTALVPAGIGGALLLFVAVRFLLGAGEAVIYPAANQFIARWIPVRERGIANGWIFAGVGAGAGLTPPFITYFMIHYGWRSSFWVCAIIGVVAGAVWFVAARDTPSEHPRVSAEELAVIRSGLTVTSGQSSSDLVPWRRVVRSREVWAVTISYFCYGYVAWIFFSWFYRYLAKVRGLDLKASAFYSMLPFLAMLVCCLVGGTLNDRLTKWRGPRLGRCYLAVFAMGVAGIFIAFGSQVESVRLASIVLAGGAGALYFVPEFVLVSDSGYCGRIRRICFRIHEYGRTNGWSLNRITHPLDCCSLRLDRFVPRGCRVMSVGRAKLARGGSAAYFNAKAECRSDRSSSGSLLTRSLVHLRL